MANPQIDVLQNGTWYRCNILGVTEAGGVIRPVTQVTSAPGGSSITVPHVVSAITTTAGSRAVSANASASSDPDGIATYTFAWGDGVTTGPQTAATATHTYTADGTYTVTTTVVDNAGTSGTDTDTISVSVGTATTKQIEMGFSGYGDYGPGTRMDRGVQALGAPPATTGWNGAPVSSCRAPDGTRGPFYSGLPATWDPTPPRGWPGARVYVSFTKVDANTSSWAASAPSGTRVIFNHEAENLTKGFTTGAQYLTAYRNARNVIKAANPNIQVGMASASYAYRPAANGGTADVLAGNWLPGPTECDFYGVDCYEGDQNNPDTYPELGAPARTLAGSTKFMGWYNAMIKKNPPGAGQKPWGLTEYGINFALTFGSTNAGLDAERAAIIPQDYQWLKARGASIWLYWYYVHNPSGTPSPTREFVDQGSLNAWRNIVWTENFKTSGQP